MAFLTSGPEKKSSERLLSLDALRGFDMMWIISGELIIHAWAKASPTPVPVWMSDQLHHSPWNGFTFYDMIFPLFIFIAGISMPYSFGRQMETAGVGNERLVRRKIFGGLLKRTLILIVCGMVVNGLLRWQGYELTRFASVLGRIGLACFFAALIFLHFPLKKQLIWFVSLLLGYWALMMWVPVPGFGAGVLTPEGNLEGFVDRILLPGKLHRVVYDPEGILSTLPAIATAMLGIFTGQFLRWKSDRWTMARKGFVLGGAGLLMLCVGYVWGLSFPVNKNMWTSSFVLVAGGWSVLLLSVFYLVIDVLGYRKWCMPFVWIGMNSILIYMAAHGVVNFEFTSSALFGGLIKYLPEIWQPVWLSVGILLIQVGLVYVLYRNKWFLKV